MKNFPHLVEMYKQYKDQGLVVISVSLDLPEDKAKVERTLKGFGATFPNFLLDEGPDVLDKKLRVLAAPHAYVFNREGRWISLQGEEQANAANVEKQVKKFLQSK